MSVERNLRYGMPRSGQVVGFADVVDLLGIGHLLHRRPAALSGGEEQRVAIGRALLGSPTLLLMDEPLASLDQARKDEVLPFLAKLPRELRIPILYVSHTLEEVLKLADTLVRMEEGRVVDSGTVQEVSARTDVGRLAGSVLNTHVAGHEEDYGLTRLEFSGRELRVPRLDLPPGTAVRLQIHPHEVILARTAPAGTSVQNILPATVTRVDEVEERVLVRLDVGAPLTALISRRAAAQLALRPGDGIHALVKAHSIARRRIAPHA